MLVGLGLQSDMPPVQMDPCFVVTSPILSDRPIPYVLTTARRMSDLVPLELLF